MIRRATEADLASIVAMLADDDLGAQRESPDDLTPYRKAFEVIDVDPHQLLIVAERGGAVVGTLQLSRLAGLSRKGSFRAQVEGVRVASSERSNGLGQHLMEWAVGQARSWGCQLVQLTSDKARTDAHRFYDRLGFIASHEGYKLSLETVSPHR
jgi:GNAT superfamily N-acetyltransferase